MQITEDRFELANDFAVERDVHAKNAVRGWMLRPHRDFEQFAFESRSHRGGGACFEFVKSDSRSFTFAPAASAFPRHRAAAAAVMLLRFLQHFVVRRRLVFVIVRLAIIFPHRVIFELIPHQDAAQIGMTVEANAVEIENFALLKFRAPPDRRERRQMRALLYDPPCASE
jgi:hypothetical protein